MDDLIRRSDAIRVASGYCHWTNIPAELAKLPSVNTEKTGRWKRRIVDSGYNADWSCSVCGYKVKTDFVNFKYCPNCGCRMVEPQETETWNGIHAKITAPKGTFERILNEADDDNDI